MKKEQLIGGYLSRIFCLNSILIILCISCGKQPKNYITYEDFFYPNHTLLYGPYFAFKIENEGEIEKIVLRNEQLMKYLVDIGGFNEEDYKDSITHIIKNDIPLKINNELFTFFKINNLFIKPDKYIDSLFNTSTLKNALNIISNPPSKGDYFDGYSLNLEKEKEKGYDFRYLIYILFKHQLYVTLADESGELFIMYNSKGLEKLE